jgi:hypothetical protein
MSAREDPNAPKGDNSSTAAKEQGAATAVAPVAAPRPTVTLSIKTRASDSGGRLKLCGADKKRLGLMVVAGLIAFLPPLINDYLIQGRHVVCTPPGCPSCYWSIVASLFVDSVLFVLLFRVFQSCVTTSTVVYHKLPTRHGAMLLLALSASVLIAAFGRLNDEMHLLSATKADHPYYEAFLTVTMIGHDAFEPTEGFRQALILFEELSAMLLLIVLLPLLVGRLAMFAGETGGSGTIILTAKCDNATVKWDIEPQLLFDSAPADGSTVELTALEPVSVAEGAS